LPTGTTMDQTLFVPMDLARKMLAAPALPEGLAAIPEYSITEALVRVEAGADPHLVALDMIQNVPDISPIESPALFRALRKQLSGLLFAMIAVLAITWCLSGLAIGLIFSMAANERRRELGVLRVLGASRRFVFLSLLAEAVLLALVGGFVGIVLGASVILLFGGILVEGMGIPFVVPSAGAFAVLSVVGVGVELVTVGLAAVFPALRVSRQEPANAMRE
jgi:putative ABC transport system permease protein